jgi:transcriptional regulator with XRE-family HTH domain
MSTTPPPGWKISPANLRRIVAASGKSTEQHAVSLGISYRHLYAVMHGTKQPSTYLVIRLAEEFGCHPGELFEPSKAPRSKRLDREEVA